MGSPTLISLNPSPKGAGLSVALGTDLANVNVDGMTLGTMIWVQEKALHFALQESTSAVDHSTIEAVKDNSALRWMGTVSAQPDTDFVPVSAPGPGVDAGPAINTAFATAVSNGLAGVSLGCGVFEIATECVRRRMVIARIGRS
jgi:hypothetical protein